MMRLPTVVLRHETHDGGHYDWLVGDPALVGDASARLWTVRTDVPPTAWRAAGTWPLVRIGHHRRAYLNLQGPISGGRGEVRRIDRGWVVPRLWCIDRIVLTLAMSSTAGEVELCRIAGHRWRARWRA